MATLTSFFGGGGGCCVDPTTNEWGTLLPTPHTVYTKCSVFSECLPTACFTTSTNCCATTLGLVPLKDNYFAAIALQGNCQNTRSWSVRHYCISDSGNICRQSDWCRINQHGSCNYLALQAVSDGCGMVYFEYKDDSSGYYKLSTFCVDFANCNICCACCSHSYFCRNESGGGGVRSNWEFSGKPGRVFAFTKNGTCHGMLFWYEDGEPCCQCRCAQYGGQCDGKYLFAHTKSMIHLIQSTSGQCTCVGMHCLHTACSPQVFKDLTCCTVNHCCNGLFQSDDGKPFYVELDYCGASAPEKNGQAFLRYAHNYSSALPSTPERIWFGEIKSTGVACVVSDNAGATHCNRQDRRGIFMDGSLGTSNNIFCNIRRSTQVNGVIVQAGNFTNYQMNTTYRKFYPKCIGCNNNGTCSMSLGPMSYSLEASENQAAFKAFGDRKVYPMTYEMPANNRAGDDICYKCFNGEWVIGKCWLVGAAITYTSGSTGCAFYCFNVFKMSNYFA